MIRYLVKWKLVKVLMLLKGLKLRLLKDYCNWNVNSCDRVNVIGRLKLSLVKEII